MVVVIYYCDDKALDFSSDKFQKLVNKYGEGSVYKKDGFVYKIHYDEETLKKNLAVVLNEDSCKYLTSIKTKRFFLPLSLIYDEDGNYSGYKAQEVSLLDEDKIKVVDSKPSVFLNEIEIIKNDLNNLTLKRVRVSDFGVHNLIDNGTFNIIDPGRYTVDINRSLTFKAIYQRNKNELKLLVRDILDSQILDLCGYSKVYKFHDYIKSLASFNQSYLDVVERESREYDSIKDFATDICKRKVLK